jgi:hypothetical protein
MMKKIPEKIEEIFCRRMQKAGVAYPLQQEYRKWLRYYLDFCSKYYLNPSDRETPQQFMQKLIKKSSQLKRFVLAPRARAKRLSLLSSAFMATQSP